MRRIVLFGLLCLIYLQCGNLDRDNPLDPRNPNSYMDRGILVELFVNDGTGFDYCNYALDAIEKISERTDFKGKLFVLQYHLTNHQAAWRDEFADDEFNQRYYEYVPKTIERGIPDAMFNGLVYRVQGASLEKIEERYNEAAQKFLGDRSFIRIETEKKIFNNTITIDVTIARYGKSNAEGLDLCVVLYEDLGVSRQHFVVKKIFQKQTIPFIKHGAIKSFRFSEQLPQVRNINQLYVLVFLQAQNSLSKEVLQVAKF